MHLVYQHILIHGQAHQVGSYVRHGVNPCVLPSILPYQVRNVFCGCLFANVTISCIPRIDDLLVAAAAGGVHSACMRATPPDVQFIPGSVCVCQCGRCSHPAAAPLTTTNSSAVLFFERLNSTAPKLHPPTCVTSKEIVVYLLFPLAVKNLSPILSLLNYVHYLFFI